MTGSEPDDAPPLRIVEGLRQWALRTPTRVAAKDVRSSVTFAELDDLVGGCSEFLEERLHEIPLGADGVLPVVVDRSVESVVAIHACLRAGIPFAPLDPDMPTDALAGILGQLGGPTWALASRQEAGSHLPDSVAAVPVPLRPVPSTPLSTAGLDQTGIVIFTSGSTRQPRGVVYDGHLLNGLHTRYQEQVPNSDPLAVTTALSPFHFLAGLSSALRLSTGPSIRVIDPTEIDAVAFAELLDREEVTYWGTVPSLGIRLRARWPKGLRLHRVRTVQTYGEPLYWEQVPLLRSLVSPEAEIVSSYAASEAPGGALRFHIPHDAPQEAGRVPLGRPVGLSSVRFEPVGLEGDRLSQIVITGVVARGYLGEPELSAERFGVDENGIRCWRSGDLAERLPDGRYRHAGRLDDLVKVGGKLANPAEVEEVMLRVRGVLAAVVVPQETASNTSRLVAHIEVDEASDLTSESLRSQLATQLSPHMLPSVVQRHEHLPVTARGKVDRTSLAQLVPQPWRTSTPRPGANDRERVAVQAASAVLDLDDVQPEDDLWELGLDSLAATELAVVLTDLGWSEVHPSDLLTLRTPAAIAEAAPSRMTHRDSPFVWMNAEGQLPPLYCVPGAGGTALAFGWLAAALGSEQPVVVMEANGMHNRGRPDRSVGAAGARLARVVLGDDRVDPVVLAGHSAGGAIAFEAARHLAQAGRSVRLVLLDASLRAGRAADEGVRRTAIAAGNDPGMLERLRSRSIAATASAAMGRARVGLEMRFPGPPSVSTRRYDAFVRISTRAQRRYVPTLADVPTTLLFVDGSRAAGTWSPYIPDLEALRVDGDHGSMLLPPHVRDVATHVRDVLRQAVGDSQW